MRSSTVISFGLFENRVLWSGQVNTPLVYLCEPFDDGAIILRRVVGGSILAAERVFRPRLKAAKSIIFYFGRDKFIPTKKKTSFVVIDVQKMKIENWSNFP